MSDLITLNARLTEDAQARCTATGEHLLFVRVQLPDGPTGKAITARACKAFGSGPAADWVCKARARHMRRGVRVRLSFAGITWQRGLAELHGVDQIETPDFKPIDRGYDR